jgi:hypothetical protein
MVLGAVYSSKDSPFNATKAAKMQKTPYCEVVGSLMYAAVATWPDISHAVSALSHFLDNPGSTCWKAIKHVFHYLVSTQDLTLTYSGECHDLTGYTDANSAIKEHRHAISGYAFLIDGGAIS